MQRDFTTIVTSVIIAYQGNEHLFVEGNKGSNYPLILHRKRNTEKDIKQSLPYGTAPGIEC